MDAGMKNGEMRRGPPSMQRLVLALDGAEPADARRDEHADPRRRSPAVTDSRASSTANCDAAIANWMKTSIFLTSFLSMNCSGSKSLTSPAMRAENCDASNRVIGPMPLRPAQSASQFASVPMPSGDTRPTPVTTTRLLNSLLTCRV